MTPIPLLDLCAEHQAIAPEVEDALLRVVRAQRFILGPEVEHLESELAEYLGTPHAIGVSSGTDALLLALYALNVGPGDEVITTPFSFFATAGSIIRCGATPVFADIDPLTANLDPDQVAKKMSSHTRAIIVVHLFGLCADVLRLKEVAGSVPIIEDAAQAIGAELAGRKAGTLGTLGCFSFFPSKNLGGYGDGGLITTRDDALATRLRALRVHGQTSRRFIHEHLGGNFRLDAIQAAVLRVKLRHLESWTTARRAHAETYRQLFIPENGLLLPAGDPPGGRHVYNQFVIRAGHRDRLQQHLAEQKIGTAVYYPLGLHLQPCLSSLGYQLGDFPQTEKATQESLALPIYPALQEKHIQQVAREVLAFLDKTPQNI